MGWEASGVIPDHLGSISPTAETRYPHTDPWHGNDQRAQLAQMPLLAMREGSLAGYCTALEVITRHVMALARPSRCSMTVSYTHLTLPTT